MLWTDIDKLGLFDPWRAFERLNRAASGSQATSANEFPTVNVWANGDKHIITSELPGVEPKDVDISVAGKTVTLRGMRKTGERCEGECQNRHERWSGQFSRTIEFPYVLDQEKVEARFSKGVLQVTLPRAEADKPMKISIQTE